MMENKVTFRVTLEFSDDVPVEDHQRIAENVVSAIEHQANTACVVPDDAEYYTNKIMIIGDTIETIQGSI